MIRYMPPPLIVVLLGAGMWLTDRAIVTARIESAWRTPFAIALAVVSLSVLIAAVAAFIVARTSINPMRPARASQLITSGVFKLTRNPIYVADLLLLTAWAVWLGNICNLLFLFVFFTLIQHVQMAAEERALSQLFGERYRAYCSTVRRWL